MEAVILVGMPGSGKSTYFKKNYSDTHIRINLDMMWVKPHGCNLSVREREDILLKACIDSQMPFVVDNTNMSIKEREKYISLLEGTGYKKICILMGTSLDKCLERNESRERVVPKDVIFKMNNRFEIPTKEEGFDRILQHFTSI